MEGAERAPSRLLGPASRAPEISKYEEADEATDASDSHDDKDAPVSARGACQPADGQDAGPDAAATGDCFAEASIAIDPTHHLKPVKMMQALRAQLDAMIFDIQSVARSFGEQEKAELEMATKEAEQRSGGTAGVALGLRARKHFVLKRSAHTPGHP